MRAFPVLVLCATALLMCCKEDEPVFDPSVHFVAMETTRAQKPVDFGALAETYTTNLAQYVQGIDAEAHQRVTQALEKGRAGEQPHVQSQVVSKVLQKAFFAEAVAAMERLKGLRGKEYQKELAALKGLYRCLQPTVVRRSEWIGLERELDERCRHELGGLNGTPDGQTVALKTAALESLLTRVYVLSVLYELEGIEKNRGVDSLKCEEKVTEATLFLETVTPYARSDSIATALQQELGKGYAELDVEAARALVRQAFPTYQPAG